MKKQKISDAVIHRLPRYYRYLDDLYNKGVVRISSTSLGAKMDITASQIRQDLSCFGEFGQQGYGYNVAELRAEIGHILGIDSWHRIIVVGVGHLGHALLQNFDFEKVGFRIDSAFDVSPALIGTEIRGVTVHSMDELEEIPIIPASYSVTRNIMNAFREVVNNNENPRDTLMSYNRDINEEITRKRENLGLDS